MQRQNVRTRFATNAVGSDWILTQNSIVVPGHNVRTGVLPIYVAHTPGPDVQELHCTLTLTDTEGATTQSRVTVPSSVDDIG